MSSRWFTGRCGACSSCSSCACGRSARRRSKSLFCVASCRCWSVRSRVRSFARAIGSCSLRSAACCHGPLGGRSLSRRRRFFAGTASWSRAAGSIRIVALVVRRHQLMCASWCCGWHGRIRAGGTGGSRASWSGLGSHLRRARSGRSCARPGSSRRPRRLDASWAEFLRRQAASILECDFLTVDTLFFKRFYILFVIELASRRVHLCGVTAQPGHHLGHPAGAQPADATR